MLTWVIWFACTGANLAGKPKPDEIGSSPQIIQSTATPISTEPATTPIGTAEVGETMNGREYADVTQVTVSGSSGSYRFLVTVESSDTGCDRYADWWEVLSLDGELLYRRVLLHSHANEQPFTRSGSSVNLRSNDGVIVRAHMNTSGYGGTAMRGTPEDGFEKIELPEEFAKNVEVIEPLPADCAF